MIQTINLTKRYGNLMALANLNLEIAQGDCFGFIGPNGAGKTTTIKVLATLLKPTWGEARIDGLSVGPVNARQVRSVIGYVPDYFGSYEDMVVQEYLEFFAATYNIHGDKRKQVIGDVLDLTDLAYKIDAEVNSLSRGMQQRLSVARVLLHDPKVLLLDEPASGLDPRARIEMRELLKELHRMGKTILISSHILLELADLCNRVGIIEQGELKYNGTMQDIIDRARSGGGAVLHVGVAQRVEQAAQVIRQIEGVAEATVTNNHIRVTLTSVGEAPGAVTSGTVTSGGATSGVDPSRIAYKLISEGFALTRLEEEKVNLETAFMRLTKGLVQ
jgi:ABC-2 type transport system ATP-binding protein